MQNRGTINAVYGGSAQIWPRVDLLSTYLSVLNT